MLQIEGVARDLNANVSIPAAELYRQVYHMQLPDDAKELNLDTGGGDGNDGDGGDSNGGGEDGGGGGGGKRKKSGGLGKTAEPSTTNYGDDQMGITANSALDTTLALIRPADPLEAQRPGLWRQYFKTS